MIAIITTERFGIGKVVSLQPNRTTAGIHIPIDTYVRLSTVSHKPVNHDDVEKAVEAMTRTIDFLGLIANQPLPMDYKKFTGV